MKSKKKTDYYNELGVPRNATAAEVKRTYRKKAAALHPDLNPNNPEAEDSFKRVAEAYSILGNEQRRQLYDRTGSTQQEDLATEVRESLKLAFGQAIDAGVEQPVDYCKQVISKALEIFRVNLSKTITRRTNLKQQRNKVKVKQGCTDENIYLLAIDEQLHLAEQEVATIEHQIEVSTVVLKVLDNYQDYVANPYVFLQGSISYSDLITLSFREFSSGTESEEEK